MKERYLSKTPFLTFVYLSKCNIYLPGCFRNSKKRFLWTGLVHRHTALRDAWCLNSKFCNKGRYSMNWRDRRESVNNAKSSSSLTGFVSNPQLHCRLYFTFLLLRLYCWSAGWRQCFWAHKTQPIHQTHQTHKLCQTDKSLVTRPTRVSLKLREKSAI